MLPIPLRYITQLQSTATAYTAAANGTAEAVEEDEDATADETPEVIEQQPEVVSVEAEEPAA